MFIINSLAHDSEKALDYIRGISPEAAATLQEIGSVPRTMTASNAGFPDQLIHDQLVEGHPGRWRRLDAVAKDEAEKRLRAILAAHELVLAPEVEFDEEFAALSKAGLI